MEMEDLRQTAALAHLNLDEKELSGAFSAFEQMLGYFAAMQAADGDKTVFPVGGTAGASSAASPAAGLSAVARTLPSTYFRPDSPHPQQNTRLPGVTGDEEVIARMLDSAGERDGRFVVVPNVL
ncbi:MAG: aspartyl/glutamyl-tRNA amidotransferase subunit C [Treponema sp.]|jgi:aspartyl-tRNA(Asn)/glutamyl-tRNA(Gln) amidotransferase subunit C|nr:aspartyl/glutamyl-tRNA amidotransferase subunit C [Treponema sp.]